MYKKNVIQKKYEAQFLDKPTLNGKIKKKQQKTNSSKPKLA
jgi:hypothetical protein